MAKYVFIVGLSCNNCSYYWEQKLPVFNEVYEEGLGVIWTWGSPQEFTGKPRAKMSLECPNCSSKRLSVNSRTPRTSFVVDA